MYKFFLQFIDLKIELLYFHGLHIFLCNTFKQIFKIFLYRENGIRDSSILWLK